MKICVYGAASKDIDAAFITAGEALGESLSKRGHDLVFGGGNDGLMGAVARGTHRGGGHITGIAPSFFNVDGVLYELCDEYIYTTTMRERKQKMEDLSDAFIVSPGGIGTFEEFFEILTLRQLKRHAKPIAILNTDGYYDHMLAMLRNTADRRFMSERNLDLFFISADVDEILDYIETPLDDDHDIAAFRNLK